VQVCTEEEGLAAQEELKKLYLTTKRAKSERDLKGLLEKDNMTSRCSGQYMGRPTRWLVLSFLAHLIRLCRLNFYAYVDLMLMGLLCFSFTILLIFQRLFAAAHACRVMGIGAAAAAQFKQHG
jgi:hypothetical protein